MKTSSLVINQELDPSIFSPPVLKLTPLQKLMDQLFQERSDTQAVMWSYADFRTAHPDLATDESSRSSATRF